MRLVITGSTGIAGATADLARARGGRVFTVGLADNADFIGDLRDEAVVARAFADAVAALGEVDALFNVAGISGRRYGDAPWHECTADGYEATLASNLRTTFLMTREALRYWLAGDRPGTVLNMGSVLASRPETANFAAIVYAASKGAIESMTISGAAFYAKHRIRMNVIAPGLVRTPMSERAQSNDAIQAHIKLKQPLSDGMIEPGQIARAALFLLEPDSSPITGQVLAVDGGWSVLP